MKNLKKVILIPFIFLIIFLISCENNVEIDKITGTYNLTSANLGGTDITEEYTTYSVKIEDNYKMHVIINYLNLITVRDSDYSVSSNTIIESHNNKKYEYAFDEQNNTLTTSSVENTQKLVIVLTKEEKVIDETTGVDFEGILFGDPIEETKIFNYAPAIILEEDEEGNQVMHIWYCTNRHSGVIMDHIGYRQGILNKNDKWEFSDETIVLAPTPDTWDSRHVCDPTVIKGEFYYQGEIYNYMMSYLGCETEDYSNNETGIAISKTIDGDWVKMNHLNPIVPWSRDNRSGLWGTGMPSLISVDDKAQVLLFYSNSANGIGVELWDFSNLDESNQAWVRGINFNGAKNPNGTALSMGIADFAYDPLTKRLYVVSYTNTQNPPDVTKTRVNSHAILAYIDNLENMDEVVAALESRNYIWTVAGYVGPEETGYTRNHNLGIVKDSFGKITDSSQIHVIISTGNNSWANDNIFTYRLLGYIFKLNEK